MRKLYYCQKFAWAVCAAAVCLPLPLCAQHQLLPVLRTARPVPPAVRADAPVFKTLPAVPSVSARRMAEMAARGAAGQAASSATPPAENVRLERAVAGQMLAYEKQLEEKNQALLDKIEQLWEANVELSAFSTWYPPLYRPNRFSIQNNRIVLSGAGNFLKKVEWLKAQPGQGQNALNQNTSSDMMAVLAEKLSAEKLVFLGEAHFLAQIQQSVGELLWEIKKQNPNRRIVLLTEFFPLPAAPAARQGASYFSYYRQPKGGELQSLSPDLSQVKLYYAENLFSFLLKKKFEIYPLEDISQCNLLIRAQGICPDMRGATSMLAVAERNKSWARIIETKMAEIRKTDPDALFIVYAGMMHTSWIIPYAMPKFFASENPVVVEFTWRESLSLNTLGAVWTIKHPFFRFYEPNSLFYWTGAQARQFGRQTGFDYAVRLWFE